MFGMRQGLRKRCVVSFWSSGWGSILGTGERVRLWVWPGRSKGVVWNETGAERTVCGFILLVQWLRQYFGDRRACAPVGLAWEKQGRCLKWAGAFVLFEIGRCIFCKNVMNEGITSIPGECYSHPLPTLRPEHRHELSESRHNFRPKRTCSLWYSYPHN